MDIEIGAQWLLFREAPDRYWRLTYVENGIAYANWIYRCIDTHNLAGEWRVATKNEIELASMDVMGRLK